MPVLWVTSDKALLQFAVLYSYFKQGLVRTALAALVWQLQDLITKSLTAGSAWEAGALHTTVLDAAKVQFVLTLQATEIRIKHICCGACSLALAVLCFSAPRYFPA